mgnify:CR=1 FL=1
MRAKPKEKVFAEFLLQIDHGTYPICDLELPQSIITNTDILLLKYMEITLNLLIMFQKNGPISQIIQQPN